MITTRAGLANSPGCSTTKPSGSQRCAPLISGPTSRVRTIISSDRPSSAQASRRTPTGESSELPSSSTRRRQQIERMPAGEMQMRQPEALGDRRAGGEHEHHARSAPGARCRPASAGRPSTTSAPAGLARCARTCSSAPARGARRLAEPGHQRLEGLAAGLEIGELVERCAGRRQQHHRLVAGIAARRLGRLREGGGEVAALAAGHAPGQRLGERAAPPRRSGRRGGRDRGRARAARARPPSAGRRRSSRSDRSSRAPAPRLRDWSPCCR